MFEFVALSEGRDEPVEFYYGADDRLGVLEQRLRSMYPSSFDIDRVEVDLWEKSSRRENLNNRSMTSHHVVFAGGAARTVGRIG